MKYSAEHTSALADILDAGTSVTFSRVGDATYNEATDVATTATTTITGAAIQVKGKPETYRALSLIQSAAPTLLFCPTTEGNRVLPGDTVSWSGITQTVQDAEHIAIAGDVILSRVVVAS